MNASRSYRSPSRRWLLAAAVALLGFGFASPARADDPTDPAAAPVVTAPKDTEAGTDSYGKGNTTDNATVSDSYGKG